MGFRRRIARSKVLGAVCGAIALWAGGPSAWGQGGPELTQLVARVDPAVVTILLDDHGQGSGFVLDAQGLVLTNYHVIEGAKSATVIFADKTSLPVDGFLAIAVGKDLALLQIQPGTKKLQPLRVAEDPPAKGERVFAFGAPLGLSGSVSDGIVASLRSGKDVRETFRELTQRDIYQEIMGYDLDAQWLQTTAPISPGNSGGPLVNARGEVIGINTWVHALGQNLNFALSAVHVKHLCSTAGKVPQPFSKLPPPRPGQEVRLKGDAQKSLALWKQLTELRIKFNKTKANCEKKFSHVPAPDPRHPHKGSMSRLKKMSPMYDELAKNHEEYAVDVRALECRGADPELLVLIIIETDLAQRISDTYQELSTALASESDDDAREAETRLKNLIRANADLRTTRNLIRVKLSRKYDVDFPTIEAVRKAIESGEEAAAPAPQGNEDRKARHGRSGERPSGKAARRAVLRVWSDPSGEYQLQAKYLGLEDGKVKLAKTDGTVLTVAVENLSEADRRFLGIQK